MAKVKEATGMARKRAVVSTDSAQRALGTDILDRILEAEGLVEVPVIEVSVAQVDPNPYQTRREFDEEGLQELATSIRVHGFYGHLVARQVSDRYQLAYGERRLRAAQQAGLTQIPLAVRDLTDEQMMEMAITENVLRRDLNPIEEAEAYQHLANLGYSLRQISEKVGKSPGHISMLLNLLKKEDVAEAVRQERVGIREAHEIAKVEDTAKRQELLDRTARGELDREAVKQAVRMVQEQAVAPPPMPAPPAPAAEPGLEIGETMEVSAGEAIAQTESPLRLPNIYDPLPNLRAALKQLERINPERFADIEKQAQGDIRALLNEIASRARRFLEQLQEQP
jgi:ParB family chromosome partitioning protein